jgi:phytoene/squalene synthetase
MSAVARPVPDESAVLGRAATENFSVASLVLGRATRDHLLAVYGFARLVDQLGDDVDGDRLAQLDWLEAEVDRVYDGVRPEHRSCSASLRPF